MTLIKLHKRSLDELRRRMGALENQKSQLQLASQRLREELQKEMELAGLQPGMANFFGGFATRMQNRQGEIAAEIKSLDQQMSVLNVEINEAFSELKKFEIALENEKLRRAEDQRRKDTIALDEIASQQFQRRKEES